MQADEQANSKRATLAHVVPFVAWLVLMVAGGEPAGWKYGLRAGVGLTLSLGLRPWRWYGPVNPAHLPGACGVGVLVFAGWVVWESDFAWVPEALRAVYLRWGVRPWGELPLQPASSPFAPAICGWGWSLVRVFGSAAVIAPIEEFFWRGFVYRWLIAQPFTAVHPGRLHLRALLIMSLLFGLEHERWLAGVVAGAVYGWWMIRTRDIWAACLAHGVTNLLLGVYVLATGSYAFW